MQIYLFYTEKPCPEAAFWQLGLPLFTNRLLIFPGQPAEQAQYFHNDKMKVKGETIMTCYYLLRNNKEYGPFAVKELTAMGLLTTDLVWINGQSTCWLSPTEIAELRDRTTEPPPPHTVKKQSALIPHSASTTALEASTVTLSPDEEFTDDSTFEKPSFEQLKKKYAARAPRKKVWKSQINIGANLVGIATLVIGVSLAAFMLKKAVDNIEPEPFVATAVANDINGAEVQFVSNTSSHLALPPAKNISTDSETKAVDPATPTTQPTVTNTAAVKDAPEAAKIVVPPPVPEKIDVSVVPEITLPTPRPLVEAESKKTAPERINENAGTGDSSQISGRKVARPGLKLSANDYKVGLSGGVSNLELTVANPSSQMVRNAVVKVEYLKADGTVVDAQNVEVSSLAPGSSNVIAVPDNGRGVSVRYKVINLSAREH